MRGRRPLGVSRSLSAGGPWSPTKSPERNPTHLPAGKPRREYTDSTWSTIFFWHVTEQIFPTLFPVPFRFCPLFLRPYSMVSSKSLKWIERESERASICSLSFSFLLQAPFLGFLLLSSLCLFCFSLLRSECLVTDDTSVFFFRYHRFYTSPQENLTLQVLLRLQLPIYIAYSGYRGSFSWFFVLICVALEFFFSRCWSISHASIRLSKRESHKIRLQACVYVWSVVLGLIKQGIGGIDLIFGWNYSFPRFCGDMTMAEFFCFISSWFSSSFFSPLSRRTRFSIKALVIGKWLL